MYSCSLTEKPEHEDGCEYRPYHCPCPGASCKWSGSLDQVMAHLNQSHKTITTLQGEDIVFLATDINLAGAVDWVMMQSCFGHHFMLVSFTIVHCIPCYRYQSGYSCGLQSCLGHHFIYAGKFH